MEGIYDPSLVSLKKRQLRSGKFSYNILYDQAVVGKVMETADKFRKEYGKSWAGFLFCETAEYGKISTTAENEAEVVLSQALKILKMNFDTITEEPARPDRPTNTDQQTTQATATSNSGGSSTPAATPPSRSQSQPKPKPEPTQCLCGCGEPTKPKSKFRQGHDAKAKGAIARAIRSLESDYRPNPNAPPLELPKIMVDRARADETFNVAQYDAATIIDLAEKVGVI